MAAPIGRHVTINPYDMRDSHGWPDPQPGDWLVTWSERTKAWGTAYRIIAARKVNSTVSPRRFALRCEVAGPATQAGIGPASSNTRTRCHPSVARYSKLRKAVRTAPHARARQRYSP